MFSAIIKANIPWNCYKFIKNYMSKLLPCTVRKILRELHE